MFGKRFILKRKPLLHGRKINYTDQQKLTEWLKLNRIDTGNLLFAMNTKGKPEETRGRFPLLAARLEELRAQ